MSPETLLTWAELRAALADPETLWLLDDPRPLWLIPVLALLALGLPADRALAARGRNLAALSLRLVTLSLLLFAVAQPRIQRRVPDLAVVIAEDRSASMSPAAVALSTRAPAGARTVETACTSKRRSDTPAKSGWVRSQVVKVGSSTRSPRGIGPRPAGGSM